MPETKVTDCMLNAGPVSHWCPLIVGGPTAINNLQLYRWRLYYFNDLQRPKHRKPVTIAHHRLQFATLDFNDNIAQLSLARYVFKWILPHRHNYTPVWLYTCFITSVSFVRWSTRRTYQYTYMRLMCSVHMMQYPGPSIVQGNYVD